MLLSTIENYLHWTVSVVEHKDLNEVWTELLNSWGNEIYMKVCVLDTSVFYSLSSVCMLQKKISYVDEACKV